MKVSLRKHYFAPTWLKIFLSGGDFKGCCDLKFFLVVEQELTKREVEYVALSRDTTETDLKQRREIRSGTAFYIDQVVFPLDLYAV